MAIQGPTPLGYEQLTDLSDAVGLAEIPSDPSASHARIDVAGAAVRWRDDGTDPTAGVGSRIEKGAPFTYVGDLAALRFIQEKPVAEVNVSYYEGGT